MEVIKEWKRLERVSPDGYAPMYSCIVALKRKRTDRIEPTKSNSNGSNSKMKP